MRLAPIFFLAALGTFLVSIGISESNSYQNTTKTQALDFSGVDTLEVQSNRSATITIDKQIAPGLSYDNGTNSANVENSSVQVIKQNNKLLIKADLKYYGNLDIKIPTAVQHVALIETEAYITANDSVESLDVRTLGKTVVWNGNAKSLSIIDTTNTEKCDSYCDYTINVSGLIKQLHIQTLRGEVILGKTDQLEAVRLSVGAQVRLTLSNASGLKNIQYEPLVPEAVTPVIGE
jgi:hypothetical protein